MCPKTRRPKSGIGRVRSTRQSPVRQPCTDGLSKTRCKSQLAIHWRVILSLLSSLPVNPQSLVSLGVISLELVESDVVAARPWQLSCVVWDVQSWLPQGLGVVDAGQSMGVDQSTGVDDIEIWRRVCRAPLFKELVRHILQSPADLVVL